MNDGKGSLYEELKRQILTMELEPGQDLDEASLGTVFGLSRTPVREVFRRLEGEGYLGIRANRGAHVSPLDHKALRSFFQIAPMIYAAIGRLAVQNFEVQQLEDLKSTQTRFIHAMNSGNVQRMVIENNRFHEIIGNMSANDYLQPSLNRLLIDHARIGHTFFRSRGHEMRQKLQTASRHHDDFITAIAEYDEEKVVDLVFEHWELSRKNIEMFVAPQAIKADLNDRKRLLSEERAF